MTGEINNPDSGTEHAQPISDNDTPETPEYSEPQLEDNVVEGMQDGTEYETQEVEPQAEVSEEGATEPPAEVEQTTPTVSEDSEVTLADGSKQTVKDLIAGNMMQADYSRKTQELSNARKAVEADAQRIAKITDTLVDHLSKMVPAEPDPQLAVTSPNAYTAQRAQYDAAMATVSKMLELSEEPKAALSEMDQKAHAERIQEQNRLLTLALPETGTQDGRKKFFEGVQSVAEKVGFTADEVRSIDDHRIFILANLAMKGMQAETAKATAVEKVQKAPPAAPMRPGQGAKQANRRNEAMQNLMRDDSVENAVRALMS